MCDPGMGGGQKLGIKGLSKQRGGGLNPSIPAPSARISTWEK